MNPKNLTAKLLTILLLSLLIPLAGFTTERRLQTDEDLQYDTPPRIVFTTLQLWLDTGDRSLAAYQLEAIATAGDVKIVGIEGADPGTVFNEPPYYDQSAMQGERVIIADFSTAAIDDLPRGRFRIATIHLQVTGDIEPVFETNLTVAATVGGEAIDAQLTTTLGMDR